MRSKHLAPGPSFSFSSTVYISIRNWLIALGGILCLFAGELAEATLYFQSAEAKHPAAASALLELTNLPLTSQPDPQIPSWTIIKPIIHGITPDRLQLDACLVERLWSLTVCVRHLRFEPAEHHPLIPGFIYNQPQRAPPAS